MIGRRSVGRVGIGQVVMILVVVGGIYFGFMYLPVLMHRMTIGDVARRAAARMMVDGDDQAIREWVFAEVKQKTGVQIGTSEMQLKRNSDSSRSVNVKWTEQVKHLWGKTHVLKMEVTETAAPGAIHLKNAD